MLDNGRGVPADPVAAMVWFRKAARQGDGAAQVNLGKKYLAATDSPEHAALAYAWFNLAASSGDAQAAALKQELSVRLSRDEIQRAQRMSSSLLSSNE
jgi:hypothetical protein